MNFGTALAASHCPYCGEPIQLVVDEGEAEQLYIEDCQVCCKPIHVQVALGMSGEAEVMLRSEDDC